MGRTYAMAFLMHGGTLVVPVSRDSDWLSPGVRLALDGRPHEVIPGPFSWAEAAAGFQHGELPVLVDGHEVDRLLVARVDPSRFKIIVRNDPWATTVVASWRRRLGAALVVNGSYYATTGAPDTPLVADGVHLGPQEYDAKQGALVATDHDVSIRDLSHLSWKAALADARDGMVSYPLLLGPDGKARAIKPSDWLANRTFVGTDEQGWLVFGTTKDAFFSLARLAGFLEIAPLHLRATLNLDGGPLACQAIAIGSFEREFCGASEIRSDQNGVRMLKWPWGHWALPIALAVVAK